MTAWRLRLICPRRAQESPASLLRCRNGAHQLAAQHAGFHIGKGLLGGIISLVVGAIMLLISGSFVPGLKVKGFGGALIAAIAIGVFSWLLNLILGTAGLF